MVPGIAKITVVGAGFMGASIAALYAAYGYDVILNDQSEAMLSSFADRAMPIARSLAGPGGNTEAIFKRVTLEPSLERAVEGVALVQEVIHEDLGAKRDLFARLDKLCGKDVILATNTSSFLLSEICEGIAGKERLFGIHFVSPAHLIQAVEIIVEDYTRRDMIDVARQLMKSIDHVGIVCTSQPGFLINRIQYAMAAEIHRLVDQGVATPEDIDAAIRLSIGPRLALWGSLLREDMMVNKKTMLSVTEYIHKSTGQVHYASTPALRGMVEKGELGAATGKGWYEWHTPNAEVVAARDQQLADLLGWLKARDPLSPFHVTGRDWAGKKG